MKLLLISAIIFLGQNLLAGFEVEKPETFSAAPNGVYMPQGFDSNDNVEIFFEGEFSDACHKAGFTAHDIDEEKQHIYITDMGYYFGHDFCASMMVPYQKGVNAGILRTGQWKVFFRHSRGNFVEQGTIPVREAVKVQPDDHLYAPVEQTIFRPAHGEKPNRLELVGKFYNTCMRLDYIKLNKNSESNVIDVLPIAIMDRGGCEEAPQGLHFSRTISLEKLNKGRFLLHTRANNGRSVNEIVTIR